MFSNFFLLHTEDSKLDLLANVKSKSRSSSNNSTSSRSSSTNTKPVASKMSQLNKVTSSVAEPNALSMYQPSISMLARPVIKTSKLLNQTQEKAVEDDVEEEACKTNQVNICFILNNRVVYLKFIRKCFLKNWSVFLSRKLNFVYCCFICQVFG